MKKLALRIAGSFSRSPKYKGPRLGFLLYDDKTKAAINFSMPNYAQAILTAPADPIGFITARDIDKGPWSGSFLFGEFDRQTGYVGSKPTMADAIDEIHRRRAEANAEANLVANDPVAMLERELKAYDWYAEMSDSHAVAMAGMRHFNKIREVAQAVDAETRKALWKKHAPETWTCPW